MSIRLLPTGNVAIRSAVSSLSSITKAPGTLLPNGSITLKVPKSFKITLNCSAEVPKYIDTEGTLPLKVNGAAVISNTVCDSEPAKLPSLTVAETLYIPAFTGCVT